jgi:hypothetical protein
MADAISFTGANRIWSQPTRLKAAAGSTPSESSQAPGFNQRMTSLQLGNHWGDLLKSKQSGDFTFSPLKIEAGAGEYGAASLRSEFTLGHGEFSKTTTFGKTQVEGYAGAGVVLRKTFNPSEQYTGQAYQPNFAGVRVNAGVGVSHPIGKGWDAIAGTEVGFESSFKEMKPMPYAVTHAGIEKTSGDLTYRLGVQHLSTPIVPSSVTPMASVTWRF